MITPTALPAALLSAKPGDTLQLAPGRFGKLALHARAGLTIKGSRDTVLESVVVSGSKDIALEGLSVLAVPDATWTSETQAFRIVESQNVTLRDLAVKGGPAVNGCAPETLPPNPHASGNVLGLPAGIGVVAFNVSGLAVEGCDISLFHNGIKMTGIRGASITRNDIHHLRATPIRGADIQDVLIAENHCWHFTPWQFSGPGDHGDMVHLWTRLGKPANARIVIRDNLFEQAGGTSLLGIYLDDDGYGIGHEDVEIARNVIVNDNAQAVRLERVVSARVENNVLLSEGKELPHIALYSGSRDVAVRGNRCAAVVVDKGADAASIVQEGNRLGAAAAGEAVVAVAAWRAKFRATSRAAMAETLACDLEALVVRVRALA